jgi:hypothetical protein
MKNRGSRRSASIIGLCLIALLALAFTLEAAERDALDISSNIRLRHMPYGTILDPRFASSDSDEITGYARCGDSAIWTGHYLAAEAFRYKATSSLDALNNVKAALNGLRSLTDITGTDLLARCLVPASSPYAAGITQEEAQHGVHTSTMSGAPHYWVGNTSRDQYCGVFFGLAVAFDMVDDAGVRSDISVLGTRLLDFLIRNGWNVPMPDGNLSTTFLLRPDQRLTLLQIGRRINPDRFGTPYTIFRILDATSVGVPIATEVLDDHISYFKFNLDTINLYNLIRLESSSFKTFYDDAYNLLRRTTDGHGNAHFNMIDRALRGPDAARDAATRAYLRDWLLRPRRDPWIDRSGQVPACGSDRACSPLAIADRVTTDFLWQRSPFLLYGGGEGRTEGAGIDYILPYWMGRYYGVISADPQPPEAISVSPSEGSGSNADFRIAIWDPNGHADVARGLIVINQALSPLRSCLVYYDRERHSIWLAGDTALAWRGPAVLGTAGQLRNSQCAIDAGRSSDSGSGEIWTLILNVGFPAGAGRKSVFVYAQDAGGAGTNWKYLGGWNVP